MSDEAPAVEPHVERHVDPREPDGYEPASNVILQGVRQLILDGKLAPGERIRQETLAAEYGVSRIPVREALRQLESEGLVTLIPHSGARVARVDFDECVELYRIREALEPEVLAQSVPHLSEEQIADMRARMEAVEAAASDPHTWLEEDRQFHLASYRAAPMPRALKLVEGFWNQTQQYRRAYIASLAPERLEVVHLEHRLILDAIERRDAPDAAERQRQHIRRTRVGLLEHAELFDPPPAKRGSRST
jgi:DNA-binding GntR family transcriptional regulator